MAESRVFMDIWKKVSADPSNLVTSVEAGFNKSMTENFIFIDDTKNLVALKANSGNCFMYIAKEQFFQTGYAFSLPTQAPYLEIFNKGYVYLNINF